MGTRAARLLPALSLILLAAAGAAFGAGIGWGASVDAVFSTSDVTTTTPPPYPGPPTLLSATPTATGVTLTWSPPSDNGGSAIVGYVVYRWNEDGRDPKQFTVANVTSYTDATTAKGVSYLYEVSATNATGTGSVSNYRLVTGLGPNSPAIFGPYWSYWTGSWPEAVAVGDVTGDGRADAVMVTSAYFSPTGDHRVFVFAQNADGTLAAPVRYATAATSSSAPATVAVGDITGDGRKDVLVGIDKVGVQLFPQLAGGTLGSPTMTPTTDALRVRVGQLNGDGKLDVVGIGWGTNTVAVMLNNGSGGLSAPVTYSAPHGGYDDLEVGDVSGDGRDDIVVMSGQSWIPNVSVLPQLATGGFGQTASYSVGGNVLTSGIGVGDVNGDGRGDVVATDDFNNRLAVFPQTALGTLGAPIFYPDSGSPGPVEVADLDADGRKDVVVIDSGASVFRQRADGTLAPKETYSLPGGANNPHGLAVGDVNGDGVPDVVGANFSYGLVVLRNLLPPPGSTVPGAPTLVSAVPGKASVTLRWEAPASTGGAPITGYRLYRGTASGAETFYIPIYAGASAYTDTHDIVGGSTYYYKITAVNAVGEGVASNELSATASNATVPDAPILNEANAGYDSVFLDWDQPSDGGASVTEYRIYRGTAPGNETFYGIGSGYLHTFLDSDAAGGTTYYYKVAAVNAVGESALSNELSATPLSPTVPDPPTLYSATADYSKVTLAWKRSFDGGAEISAYKVYRGTTSGGETPLATVGPGATSYTDTSGATGTTYFYKVSAVNSVGESVLSNELSAASLTPHVPDPPTLTSATGDYSRVFLTWQAGFSGGPAITGYKIYRGTTSGGETLLTAVGTQTSYYDTSGVNGTKYYYEVKAVNSAGDSVFSNELSATPLAPTAPAAPNLWRATPGYSSVTLDWDSPSSIGGSAITGYRVYRGTASGGETLLTTIGNTLGYTDTSGANGTLYYYKVSALNSIGESVLSGEVSAAPIRRLFNPYQTFSVGSWPEAVAIGDVTGDGLNDVVATTSFYFDDVNDYHLFVSAQRADGTLAPAVSYLTAATYTNRPKSVAIGDITGDGRADVVVGLVGLGVQVFPQLGSGSLGAPTLTSSTDVGVIRIGQLDGDGRLDVANAGSAVSVFLNDGQGGLKQPVRYAASGSDLEVADVTNDGRDDLAVLSGQSVSVLPQVAVGGFGSPVVYPTGANSWGTLAIGAGDVTGDGRADVVVSYGGNWPTTFVAVLAQSTGGTLGAPTAYATLDSPEAVDVADLDIDGLADVAALHGGTTSVGVHRQAPAGSLFTEERYTIPSSSHFDVHGLAVGDASGDGTPDLVLAGFTSGVTVLRNTTAPTSAPAAPVLTGAIADKKGINLVWSPPRANGGAPSGYRVYRGTASGGETLLATIGSATSFADNTAVAGTTYWYQVSAVNPRGESARSGERSATIPNPDAIAPTAPSSLKLIVAGTNQLALDWGPSTDNVAVTGYRVYRNNALVATVTTTQAVDAGLAAATNYTYTVRAIDGAGNASAASNAVSAKTASQTTSSKGNLAGAVYDATGKPLANAVVTVGSKTAKTNGSGVWQVTNLPPATYSVGVRLTGYSSQTVSVAAVAGRTVLTAVTLTT